MKKGRLTEKVIHESFKNDNLFKNDTFFKMDRLLAFENQIEEKNCSLDLLSRFLCFLKLLVCFSICNSIFVILFNKDSTWRLYLFKFISILTCLLVWRILQSKEDFQIHIKKIRSLLELDLIISICFDFHDKLSFEFSYILQKITFSFLYNMILAIKINDSVVYYILEGFFMLMFFSKGDSWFIMSFLRNTFSMNLITLILAIFILLVIQFILTKVNNFILESKRIVGLV